MVYSNGFLANSIIWIINIIFFISLLPQIFLNYKIKKANGLSDTFILGSFLGQFSYVAYSFLTNLPFVYRIMNPIYLITVSILVFQRFYYSNLCERKLLFLKYGGIVLLILILIFLLIFKTELISNFLGWLPVGIGFFKKLPQIVQTYFRKSVRGLSLGFIYLNISGYLIEMSAALFLNLPIQVIANDLKNIIIFSIFLGQSFLYKKIKNQIVFLDRPSIHQKHSTN